MSARVWRARVHYYDEARSSDTVIGGQWELVMAERKFGVGAMGSGSLDAIAYAVYRAAQRSGLTDGKDYDAWAAGVSAVEIIEDDSGESQAPLET